MSLGSLGACGPRAWLPCGGYFPNCHLGFVFWGSGFGVLRSAAFAESDAGAKKGKV